MSDRVTAAGAVVAPGSVGVRKGALAQEALAQGALAPVALAPVALVREPLAPGALGLPVGARARHAPAAVVRAAVAAVALARPLQARRRPSAKWPAAMAVPRPRGQLRQGARRRSTAATAGRCDETLKENCEVSR